MGNRSERQFDLNEALFAPRFAPQRRILGVAGLFGAAALGALVARGCGDDGEDGFDKHTEVKHEVEPRVDADAVGDDGQDDEAGDKDAKAGDKDAKAGAIVTLDDRYSPETVDGISDIGREMGPFFDDMRVSLKGLEEELRTLEPGDELPRWAKYAVCHGGADGGTYQTILFAGPDGPMQASPEPAQEGAELEERSDWMFHYTEYPTEDSSTLQIEYVPPVESELDLAVIGKVGDSYPGSGKSASDNCEAGTQMHRYSVETRDRNAPRTTEERDRFAGELCVENTKVVEKEVGADVVIQQAVAICDRVIELGGGVGN